MVETKIHKAYTKRNVTGFTLIELLVVIVILMLMATFAVINLAGRRGARDLQIAQNELVSNLRKVESYTLSSRVLPGGQPVQYYVMKFDLAKPGQYSIQAMYNVTSSPKLGEAEVIKFPPGVTFAKTNPITIDRPGILTPQSVSYPSGCALVVFRLPFNKIYTQNGCGIPTYPNVDVTTPDDYGEVLNFVGNIEGGLPPATTPSTDSVIVLKLTDKSGTLTKSVNLSAATGTVTFQ